ncbi:hypothetical protein [uncultured phage]|nr:putative YapH protein [uncultured phage]CAD8327899.1 hypothetical protein [uncultured phage]
MAFGIGIGISPLLVLNTESGSVPVNTVTPVITGNTTLNSLLSSTTGTWIGTAPITYSYQWNRNGNPIRNQTNSTYEIVLADSAASITCTVTATNNAGSNSALSNFIIIDIIKE